MKSLKGIVLTALILAVATSPAFAGKSDTFQTWAEDNKAYKKVWFGPAPSQMKKLKAIGYPKRVGLLSFYVFDTGVHSFNAMAATYGGTYSKEFGLNDAGANLFASEFAKRGVPALKKRFEEHGMELLTPVEFLENEAQMRAYIDFELPKSGFQKFAKYWTPSLQYVVGTFGKGFKGLDFAYWAKKSKGKTTSVTNPVTGNTTSYSGSAIDRAEYDGYDGVIDALARRTLEELKARYDKGK